MADPPGWDPPSPRVAELIRTAATGMLAAPDEVFAQVDAATLASARPTLTSDPVLVDAVRATNHLNLMYWARSNVEAPGMRVPPNLGDATLGIARDLVRRGLDEASLDLYRTGENTAWRQWMNLAFELTSDPQELRELLDVTARSIFTFVDETVSGIAQQIERERSELTGGTHAERLEVVTLILEGAPITGIRASTRLRYELDRRHTAAVLWTHDRDEHGDDGALERAADLLARAAGVQRALTVVASAGSLWAWIPGDEDLDLDAARHGLRDLPGVRVAIGPPGRGIDGFRRSHLDALAAQRLLHRVPDGLQVATFDDVQVVTLATHDPDRARAFVERTLGQLATADPVLRDTLRTFLREGSSTAQAARALYTHRNTVLNRLHRAQDLLPTPLKGRHLEIGLALEIVHWLGTDDAARR